MFHYWSSVRVLDAEQIRGLTDALQDLMEQKTQNWSPWTMRSRIHQAATGGPRLMTQLSMGPPRTARSGMQLPAAHLRVLGTAPSQPAAPGRVAVQGLAVQPLRVVVQHQAMEQGWPNFLQKAAAGSL